jgi:hypothetical protein
VSPTLDQRTPEAFMRQRRTRRAEHVVTFRQFVAAGLLAALPGGPAGVAQGQTPAPESGAAAAPDEGTSRRAADLTTRFRFIERYSTSPDPARPEVVVQSRVAIRETIKIETDKAKGAPDRKQVSVQTIYTECPAELGGDGTATSAVRRYDAFRLNPEPPGYKPSDARPLEGLSIWFQPRPNENPLVLSLSENRSLRENEYSLISRQVFLPSLSAILPSLPSRIGDRWRVPRQSARALLGERSQASDVLTATLQDIRTEPKGPNLVAIIAVTGQATLPTGVSVLNAQLQFTFAPPAGAGAGASESAPTGTQEARGSITELREAQVTTAPLPGSDGRLRQSQSRDLILARQRDTGAALTIPSPKPTPTEANSWILYVDPQKRYHFLHPQTLMPESLSGGDSVELVRPRLEGPDAIGIQIQTKTGNAEADRRNIDPDFHRKTLQEIWRQDRQEVIQGGAEWLPEADWKSSGMKVFRIVAALPQTAGRAAVATRRAYFNYYLILTSRPESLVVTARTLQDPPTEFHKEAEALIKTFRFGPPGAAAAPAPAPAPAR